MGVYLDKTKKYKSAIRFIAINLLILFLISTVLMPIGAFWLTCSVAVLLGIVNVPILPSSYQYAVKVSVRMPPAVLNGLMMSGATLWAVIVTIIEACILENGQVWGLLFFSATQGFAFLCTFMIRDENS